MEVNDFRHSRECTTRMRTSQPHIHRIFTCWRDIDIGSGVTHEGARTPIYSGKFVVSGPGQARGGVAEGQGVRGGIRDLLRPRMLVGAHFARQSVIPHFESASPPLALTSWGRPLRSYHVARLPRWADTTLFPYHSGGTPLSPSIPLLYGALMRLVSSVTDRSVSPDSPRILKKRDI